MKAICFALALLAFALTPLANAQGTRLWTQSDLAQLEKGTPEGIEITSDGQLRQGAGTSPIALTPSTFVWALAVDKAGQIFAATGSPATILRLDSHAKVAKPFTLFETKDLAVQALRLGPDGLLYAATLPSGRVFRLNPAADTKTDESKATVVFDPAKLSGSEKKSQYVWDLTFDTKGLLYIATGDPAAVYRVDSTKIDPAKPNSGVEEWFKTDEAHVRSLAWDGKGNLIAGTDGSGLVYRIAPDGKGYVLFEAPRREVTSVSVAPDGTIYAACVGDKARNPLPPLPVGGGGMVMILQPGSLSAANASASLPDGSEIFALIDGQAPRRLWAQKDEVVYALLARPDGLLALTGNRGHIFRIAPNGDFADVAQIDAQQVLSFVSVGDLLYLGSGNTGRIFSFGPSAIHAYASQVLDAGALARFGRVETDPDSRKNQILTRTGNIENPLRGWTDWQPLTDSHVASPAGRYLQWKAVLAEGGSLANVGVNYLPVNAAPVLDEVVVVPGARWSGAANLSAGPQTVSIAFTQPAGTAPPTADASASAPLQATKDRSAVTARWAAHDDNGDELSFDLYLKGDEESTWRLLKDHLKDRSYSFDATQLPDGGYRLKVVAIDAPSHTPGDALTAEKVSPRFELDTTPPVITQLTAKPATVNSKPALHVSFVAQDAISPLVRAEYSLDAAPWQYIEPTGKLSDSLRQVYDFQIELPDAKLAEHLITVRVYDRHDNVGLAKSVIKAEVN